MKEVDYLRRQAKELRDLAAAQNDPEIRNTLLDLAKQCDELAGRLSGMNSGRH